MEWIKRLFTKEAPKVEDRPKPENISPDAKAILEIHKLAENAEVHPCIRVVLWTLVGAAYSSPEAVLGLSLICQTYSQAMFDQVNKTEPVAKPNIITDGSRSIH